MIRITPSFKPPTLVAQDTLASHSACLPKQLSSTKDGAARASEPPTCTDNGKDQHEPSSLPLNRLPTKMSIEKINISAAESAKEKYDPFMPRIGKASDLKKTIDFKSLGAPITANCSNPVYIKDGWVYKIFLLAAATKTPEHLATPKEIKCRENKYYEDEAKKARSKIEAEAEWMQKYYDLNVDTKNETLNGDYFQITSMKDYEHIQKTQEEKTTVTQRKCIVLIMPQIRGESILTALKNKPALTELIQQNIAKLDLITQRLEEKK